MILAGYLAWKVKKNGQQPKTEWTQNLRIRRTVLEKVKKSKNKTVKNLTFPRVANYAAELFKSVLIIELKNSDLGGAVIEYKFDKNYKCCKNWKKSETKKLAFPRRETKLGHKAEKVDQNNLCRRTFSREAKKNKGKTKLRQVKLQNVRENQTV